MILSFNIINTHVLVYLLVINYIVVCAYVTHLRKRTIIAVDVYYKLFSLIKVLEFFLRNRYFTFANILIVAISNWHKSEVFIYHHNTINAASNY